MQNLPQNAVPVKAYHAQLHGLSGIVTRPDTAVLFLRDTGEVHALTDADMAHLVVLGSVAEAMSAYIQDMVRGGAAHICTSRANLEVR
jgi:hypothetical protein